MIQDIFPSKENLQKLMNEKEWNLGLPEDKEDDEPIAPDERIPLDEPDEEE